MLIKEINEVKTMQNIDQILDNEYMTEEYLDAEIIADNDDGHNLARIAHEVNDAVGTLTDVGASYRAAWLDVLSREYQYLDFDELWKVISILENNYGGEGMECPHKCGDCINDPDECVHGCDDCEYFDGGNCVHSLGHYGSTGGYCAIDCSEWNDGRY